MSENDVIIQNIWDAGDSLITTLEENKDKRIRFFDNTKPSEHTDEDGDTWDCPLIVLFPYDEEEPANWPGFGMHGFFFIDVVETHQITHVAGIAPDSGLDSVYDRCDNRKKRILYGRNHLGEIEHIITLNENDDLRIEADAPIWL